MIQSRLKEWIRACEEFWFDATRHVNTSGNTGKPNPSEIVGELRDSYVYIPARAANVRAALRDIPVKDHSQYTLVDVGSGKGRALFVAAEFPFHKVIGVEFVRDLQRQAVENIGRHKYWNRRCGDISSLNEDAAQFEFPDGNLVVYMFNPFGRDVMSRMLENLERSMEEHPRHVVVVMLWPENADLVAQMRGMSVYRKTSRYRIYQVGA